ncbi:MAG: TerC family protein [Flavobacteriales bacterium]|nr:TerC family protein [Flavobacteriales bacterium]MCB9191414.1 TerC family protein [Flavobacteriales bacterium]MCB9203960.1 TerC family protein [Flavobacteriales bacterium]
MEIFLHSETWIALLTLTFLEIVLGIDNIIFISIVTDKLPENQQAKGRNIGLGLALLFRVGLLLGITWIIGFTEPIFSLFEHEFSGRDLILLAGGLFLLGKSTSEIHHKLEGVDEDMEPGQKAGLTLGSALVQIVALDMVFSFDSILTAIGLTEHVIIMIVAVVLSMIVMMLFSGAISKFINNRPTLQILALAFLILIGFMLMIEAVGFHVPKGYIYFAVAFSLIVEMINIRMRKKRKPVTLKKHMTPDEND